MGTTWWQPTWGPGGPRYQSRRVPPSRNTRQQRPEVLGPEQRTVGWGHSENIGHGPNPTPTASRATRLDTDLNTRECNARMGDGLAAVDLGRVGQQYLYLRAAFDIRDPGQRKRPLLGSNSTE